MEVKFNHREGSGLTGDKNYFVDCQVHFSEEEKGIVKARGLHDMFFHVGAATPVPSAHTPKGLWAFIVFGRLLAAFGFCKFWYDIFTGTGNAGMTGTFLFLVGIGIMIFVKLKYRSFTKRLDEPDQKITVKRLLSNPAFTVYCFSPSKAKAVQNDIHEELSSLKNTILDSSQMAGQASYQL